MLIVLLCALLLDYFFAEPQKYHPLAGFGHLAEKLEQRLNEMHTAHTLEQKRVNGFIAALICLLPAWWLTYYFVADNTIGLILEVIILYLALGLNSLKDQARQIIEPLVKEQLEPARQALAKIVNRDTTALDSEAVSRSATESVLKDGNDAVFATIFWFIVAGAPGVVVYRLTSTLYSMWGHKNERYNDFGFVVTKFNDLLNYIPARLTGLTYAFMGNWQNAIKCWTMQGSLWESSNAGVVMAAGAGALDVQLGGGIQDKDEYKERPELGCGKKADPETISQACQLINRSTMFWVGFVAMLSLINWI